MTVTIPTLETERLTLRAPRMDDTPLITDFLQSDRAQFVGGGSHRTPMDCARSLGNIAGQWVLRGYGPHVITLKDGTPVGHGGAWFPFTWPEPELGWCLWSDEHEGKGYVTEAMTYLLDWAHHSLHLSPLMSLIDPANAASEAVAKRLGATVEGTHIYDSGQSANLWRHRAGGIH